MHHAGAGNRLKESLDSFPAPERKHHWGHGAGVQTHGADVEQVAGDAVQLTQNDADVLGAFGDFQTHQLLYGHAISQFVVEVADVVHPVEQGNDLVVLLALAQFLGASVQVADVRLNVNDFLAVHPEHHAEHAMGGGMLRPHVEQHLHGLRVNALSLDVR